MASLSKRYRLSKRNVRISVHLFLLIIAYSFFHAGKAEALTAELYLPRRVFSYSGSLGLNYDRYWTSNGYSSSVYSYSLNMGLNGFVIDSRLISFDLSGSLSQVFNRDTQPLTVEGFNLGMSLFTVRPKFGVLRYMPRIRLHYSYTSSDYGWSRGYGISLSKSFPAYTIVGDERVKAPSRKSMNNNDNDGNQSNDNDGNQSNDNDGNGNRKRASPLKVILPPTEFQLDYNRFEYESGNTSTISDRLNLRATLRTRKGWDFFATYNYDGYNDMGTSEVLTTNYFLLESNYSKYLKASNTSVSSSNKIYMESTSSERTTSLNSRNSWLTSDLGNESAVSEKTLSFTSSNSWSKNLGADLKDWLRIYGNAGYFSRNSENSYILNLGSGYSKYFSERFRDFMDVAGAYGKSRDDSYYAVTVGNSFYYQIYNNLSVSSSISLGFNEAGMAYGFNIGLPLRMQFGSITVTPSYSFSQSASNYSENKGVGHNFYLTVSGAPRRNLRFSSESYYFIRTGTGADGKIDERIFSIQNNLYWIISEYQISLGAAYMRATSGEKDALGALHAGAVSPRSNGNVHSLTLSAGVSANLTKNLQVNAYAYYTEQNEMPSTLIISPSLTWQFRKVVITARYSANIQGGIWSSNNHERSAIDHRFFLRATRHFDGLIRPLWWRS